MPYKKLNLNDAADYLHLPTHELERLVAKRDVPYELQNGNPTFRRIELRDWLTQKLLSDKSKNLQSYHCKATDHYEKPDRTKPFLTDFISPNYMEPDLHARTKNSLMRELVHDIAKTELLCDEEEFKDLLIQREELCPTGIENGIAIPHSRLHSEYLFLESFLYIAKVEGGIPFGSIDGKMTDLFFVPCATDDKLHLYMIMRLSLMVQKTDLADCLRDCETKEEMYDCFVEKELEFVEQVVIKGK